MSDSPLLSKMDALMKKHRGGAESATVAEASSPASAAAAPADAWLPVLNDVIERGTPPMRVASPGSTATGTPPMPASAPLPAAEPLAPETAEPAAVEPAGAVATPPVDARLTEQLLSELAPRLSEVMERQVAAELRRNLDETLNSVLAQLDVNMREIVRDAVAEKLKPPRDPSA